MIKSNPYKNLLFALLFLVIASCVEPYNPPAISETVDLLVVDGFINISNNSATVSLSKATPIANDDGHVPEVNATVRIEDDNGDIYSLYQEADGTYTLANMDLSLSKKYRLIIVRGNGKEYFTDYIELKQTPPIDSISWAPTPRRDGINIYANTHDENNNDRYYQWRFVETWEYTSKYSPSYELRHGVALPNTVNVYQCWTTRPSSEILIASATHLNENVILNYPLIFIPKGSPKISRRYSIIVEQRSLTKDAYDFWNQLKKTTENLGGLFDPLPSKVIGNLRSKNDSKEPVLGYFSGGSSAEQRIFIGADDLPDDIWQYPNQSCPVDSIPIDQLSSYPDMFLIGSYGSPSILGYTYSSETNCMDCRDRGGDLKKPDFWE